MKTSQLYKHQILQHIRNVIVISCMAAASAQAAITDLSNVPLGTVSAISAKPNVMVMLDDSGSMDWDYLPDNAKNFSGNFGYNSAQCNGVYYNPTITYTPPARSDGTSYPNSNFSVSANLVNGMGNGLNAWNDGYNTGAGTTDLNTAFPAGSGSGSSGAPGYAGQAFYYQYCNSATVAGCTASGKAIGTQTAAWQKQYFNSSSTFYKECQLGSVSGSTPTTPLSTQPFALTVMTASAPTTTITTSSAAGSPATIVVGSSTASKNSISNIIVHGTQIWGSTGTTSGSSKTNTTIASYIAQGINACTSSIVAPCTSATGVSATCTGYPNCTSATVTLSGPNSLGTFNAAVTNASGGISYTYTVFPSITATIISSIKVGGVELLTGPTASTQSPTTFAAAINAGINTAPVTPGFSASVAANIVTITGPNSASGASVVITYSNGTTTTPTGGMTATAGTFSTQSTAAQLQNFANWYSYYSHRMLMMKTGLGLAFSNPTLVNSDGTAKYRVGFMTMNNNVSPDFVDTLPFSGGCAVGSGTCQKDKWYTKLYTATPGQSTPLREALSHVGQYYAHKFGSITTYTAKITVGGSGNTAALSVTVNGTEILNCAFSNTTCPSGATTSQLATFIANEINAMIYTDYGASASGNVVTVTGIATSVGFAPVVTDDGGNMTFVTTPFSGTTTTATINGSTPLDPMEYSCQQNFVILSTDGYWNGPTDYNLSNALVGQQDGNEPRPMNDGGSATTQTTTQVLQSTSYLQQQETSTSPLQSSAWVLQSSTSTLQGTVSKVLMSCTGTATTCGTAPANGKVGTGTGVGATQSWSPVATCTTGGALHCSVVVPSPALKLNVGSTCNVGGGTAGSINGASPYTVTNGDNVGYVYSACSYTAATAAAPVGSCTYQNQSVASPYTVLTATTCSYSGAQATPVTAASCSTVAKSTITTNGTVWDPTAKTCAYATTPVVTIPPTAPTPCTPITGSASSPYTIPAAVTCPIVVVTSCATPGSNGCTAITTSPIGVASCTSGTSGGVTTTCQTVNTGPTASSCTGNTAASSSNGYTTTTCTVGAAGHPDTLADVAEYYYATDLRDNSLSNCSGYLGTDVCYDNVPTTSLDNQTHQHMTTFTLGLGARGSMVYSSAYQSMTTACDPSISGGDFCAVLKGATSMGPLPANSTIPYTCSWQTVGSVCNWPVPVSGTQTAIDDLWHAAVNGRGTYYSATDPKSLASGLSGTLTGITARLGSSSAATTSSPNISATNNFVFSSTYVSVDWTGNVVRQSINASTGAINCTNTYDTNGVLIGCAAISDWEADSQITSPKFMLDKLAALTAAGGSRNIYTYNPSATSYSTNGDPAWLNSGKLKSFYWANLTATEQGYFNNITGLSQYATLNAAGLASTAVGANLVNYLRGDSSNYGTLYNTRPHILGDIVDSKSSYVGAPAFLYGDTNYYGNSNSATASFTSSNATRTGMVYVGANDGMLHAFYSGGVTVTSGDGSGTEAWAYIPNMVEPSLYQLADTNYSNNHRYFVDGSPIVGDVCPNAPGSSCTNGNGSVATDWKTILVGGLNSGGRGFYALDVTNPVQPKALWEFTDPNMGYSFGNPQITKLANGTWVVLLTSGYNNVPGGASGTGDGMGHLYVVNAYTGALIRDISTGVGSTTSPSGLSRINARVRDPAYDNTTLEVYGGDLLGNVWRFDVNNNVGSTATSYEAQLITTLKDAFSVPQPITTKPEIGIIGTNLVIFVGTGELLGTTDLSTTQVQTMYAIKDPLTVGTASAATAIYASPQSMTCATSGSANCFVQQIATSTTCPTGSPITICNAGDPVLTGTNNAVNFTTQNGWYINFPSGHIGERDNTDPQLFLGTLGFNTNTPSSASACSVGGYSYTWFLNYTTGSAISACSGAANGSCNPNVIGKELGTMVNGIMNSGFAPSSTYFTLPTKPPEAITCINGVCTTSTFLTQGNGGPTRRTSWRELILQ